jgi:hypothetical protein
LAWKPWTHINPTASQLLTQPQPLYYADWLSFEKPQEAIP